MCLPFSSWFGGKNDYGVTSRDPNYHPPLSTTSSGNSYQGDTTTSPVVVPAATRYACQQGKPAAAPSTDESAKPLAAGRSNNKTCMQMPNACSCSLVESNRTTDNTKSEVTVPSS
uniref:Uncharacterized protein n=1 Tax=Oryza punctata TaxID=4537 RepID=A0A0E0JDU7_ORYPU